MKKLLSVLLILLLVFSFSACKQEAAEPESPDPPVTPATPATDEPDSPAVEPGSDEISITIPLFWVSDSGEFDPEIWQEESPYEKVTLNDDGTVTMTLPKDTYAQAMEESKQAIVTMFNEFQGDEGIPFIRNITYNDDFTDVTVEVDKSVYDMMPMEFFHDMIGMTISMHHQFIDETMKCHYVVTDAATGKVLLDKIYPDDITAPE